MTLSLWLSDMGEWYMTRTTSVRGVVLKICAACAAAHHKRTGRRRGKQQVARGAGEGFTYVFGSVSEGFVCFDIYSSSTWCAITSPRSKQAASKTTRTYTSVCRPTVGSEV